jgi:hypothetical protein
MAQIRLFDQALKVIEEIEIAGLRASATHSVISEMAEVGLFDRALELVEETEWGEWTSMQASALKTIAKAIAKAGKFDKALQVAGKIEWSNERVEALIAIAEAMAKIGMREEAKEVLEQALQEEKGIGALVAIAEAMAKIGMEERAKEVFDQALQVAEGIKEARYRAEVLGEIAEGMAKAGIKEHAEEVFDRAVKTVEKIGPDDALRRVFQEDEWISDWAYNRARALGTIAGGMAKAGMEERAKEVFKQALQMARRSRWEEEWAWALEEITKEMADAKVQERALWQQALEVSEGIKETWWRAEALKAIAEAMVRVEEVEEAVSIIEQATGMRAKILPSILQALAGQASEGDRKSKEGFLKLLPLCGWSLEFAYKACGLLAWLYPERGEEIVRVVSGE